MLKRLSKSFLCPPYAEVFAQFLGKGCGMSYASQYFLQGYAPLVHAEPAKIPEDNGV